MIVALTERQCMSSQDETSPPLPRVSADDDERTVLVVRHDDEATRIIVPRRAAEPDAAGR